MILSGIVLNIPSFVIELDLGLVALELAERYTALEYCKVW